MIMIRKSIIAFPARLYLSNYTIAAMEKAMEKAKKVLISAHFASEMSIVNAKKI